MGMHGKAKRPRRRDLSSSAGDAVDLISGLGDDVLVRILEQLPDTRDAMRTDALSRRWRGLWTRIPHLRFASWPEFRTARGAEPFAAMVDAVLALRAAQTEPAIENLAISFKPKGVSRFNESDRIVPPSIAAVQGWIRFAVLHELKSLDLELQLPRSVPSGIDDETMALGLDSLIPGSATMETMRLALCRATVQLPSSAVFASLTDLSLEHMVLADGSVHLLARLLSSACCPHLQKLRLRKLGLAGRGMHPTELPLEASKLIELSLERIRNPLDLKLRTPSLRVLRIKRCYGDALTLSAPKLERLMLFGDNLDSIDVEDELLPSLRSLKEVELWSHGYSEVDEEYNENEGTFRLLQYCATTLKTLGRLS